MSLKNLDSQNVKTPNYLIKRQNCQKKHDSSKQNSRYAATRLCRLLGLP